MADEISGLRSALNDYPDWVAGEAAGLTPAQIAEDAPEPPWASWSIDLQIRHIAYLVPVWLTLRAGECLKEAGYEFPSSAETIADLSRRGRRHVPPEVARGPGDLTGFMRPWAALCCRIIDREGEAGLRALTFSYYADPEAQRPDDPFRPIEYHRIAARLHPSGYSEDPGRPGLFHLDMCAVLRHV